MSHRGRVYAHCPAPAGMKPPLQVSAGEQAAGAFTSTTAGDPTILSETRTRNALYFLLTENAEAGEPLVAQMDVQDESGRAVGKYELTERGMEATRTFCET